jgi:2'-5' RNA ligase
VLPEVQLGETVLDRVVLFLSELRREGAVYTPLRTFPLGG